MVNLYMIIGITVVATLFAMAIGWLIYIKTRPKNISWTARCYQISEGTIPPEKDEEGNIVFNAELNPLIPYIEDTLVKIEKDNATIYKLSRLNMTTNAVTADMVDNWGEKGKYVDVLVKGSTATVMKKAYSKDIETKVFKPMSRERIELIKSEITIKKNRMKDEKNVLLAALPYIALVVSCVMLFGITYLIVDMNVDVTEKIEKINYDLNERALEIAKLNRNPNAPLPDSLVGRKDVAEQIAEEYPSIE